MRYDALGSAEIGNEILDILGKNEQGSEYIFRADHRRGFDHGVWSTLIHLFPEADIPVVTMSLDYSQ